MKSYGILPDLKIGASSATLAEANWGMSVFKVDQLRRLLKTTIKLGIVDTGVDDTHKDLAPNFKGAKDFTGSAYGYRDRHGHGTHCSGTVAASDANIGVATGFPFHHGKGLDDTGSGGNTLINAIEYCLSEGCEIVSNSWGGGGQNQDWEAFFKKTAEHPSKPWLIFAGGNSGPSTPDTDWPGRSKHLINVAALNQDLSPASFSSSGDKIDTSGPGVNIWSCKPGGGYQQMSGTSMATPFVAGLLGLYRAALKQFNLPIPNIYELRDILYKNSTDTHTPGDDRRTGPGWVTPLLLSFELEKDPPKVKA